MIHQIGTYYLRNRGFSGGVLIPGSNCDAIDYYGRYEALDVLTV
tara:strand:+ start:668 stop:799 length:132 start_codon:yes stop_codon:yes gene_type:complete